MAFDNVIHRILVVSSGDKSKFFLKSLLIESHFTYSIKMLSDSSEARRELLKNDYEIVIINAPLTDESSDELAIHVVEETKAIVILIVKNEAYENVAYKVLEYGVLSVSKPIIRPIFYQTLNSAISTQNKRREFDKEILDLKNKMEEMRIINKAKCMLIEKLHLTEDGAHKFIEKEAMDSRDKKINVALNIIARYKE